MKETDFQDGTDLTELEEFDALDFGGESEEKTREKLNYVEENLLRKRYTGSCKIYEGSACVLAPQSNRSGCADLFYKSC